MQHAVTDLDFTSQWDEPSAPVALSLLEREEEEGYRPPRPVPPEIPVALTDVLMVDPFAEEGRISPALEALPDAVRDNWNRLAVSELTEQSYATITKLAHKGTGWRGAGSLPLSAGSLRAFLDFWQQIKEHAKEPELTMTPRGNLVAEWHKNWRRHLDIEFRAGGFALYGLFDGQSLHEGRDTISGLARFLMYRERKPLRWQATR